MKLLVLVLSLFVGVAVVAHAPLVEARAAVKKIKLHGELRSDLNAVLKESVALQEASFARKDQQATAQLRALVKAIDRASAKTHLAKGQRVHLLKLLGATKDHLARAVRTTGKDRHTHMQRAFKQMVTLAQTYQLDSYKVFFCPSDRSVWLQKGSRPQNPVNPTTLGSCGKMVR